MASIELRTDIFNNEVVDSLKDIDEGDMILATWIQLLCYAAKQDDKKIHLSKNTGYEKGILAYELMTSVHAISKSFDVLSKKNLITIKDGVISFPDWVKEYVRGI